MHSSVPSTCPSSDFISQCMPVTYIEMPFIDTIPRNCYTCLKGKFEDIKVVIRSRKHDVWFVFSSSFCMRGHVLFTLFVFDCVLWCSAHIVLCFCFVFLRLLYPLLSVSLDCPFLITPSVFSNVYLRKDRQYKTRQI